MTTPNRATVTSIAATNNEESLRRKLEDLEDAYGPAIRSARLAEGCTDIAVNEDGRIWAKIGGVPQLMEGILTDHAANRMVNIVSDIDGQPITKSALNANLPTGERFAALLPPLVSRICISIRLPPKKIYTLDHYVLAGIMNEFQADVLRLGVASRKNILVVGSTGSGKTTLANGLLAEDGFKNSRTCIAQDQRELQCSGFNVIRAVTGPMTTRELVREFLRHDPDRIVIGEIRDGHAAEEWIAACNTGHPGGLSTTHASSADLGLLRISSLIAKVAVNVDYNEIAEAIDMVVFIAVVDDRRRVIEIVEPTGHDGRKFITKPLA